MTADVMWIFEEWAVSESGNKGGGMKANSKEPVWNMKSMKVCDLLNKCPFFSIIRSKFSGYLQTTVSAD